MKRMAVARDYAKARNFLILYKIEYFVFITKKPVIYYRIAGIFGPGTAQFPGQVLIIAPHFHGAKRMSPDLPPCGG